MRTVADHQDAVRSLLAPLASRAPEIWRGGRPPVSAVPRVLAVDLVNPVDLPPFDNSQMDGYAVRSAEVAPGASLVVAPRVAAGAPIGELAPGTAAPIMTGAAVPLGADAIVPIEASIPDRFQDEAAAATVGFADAAGVAPGDFVRRRGSDLPAGDILLAAGTRLGAAQWGVIAASGITEVALLASIRVLLLSTGDELTPPGESLAGGHIYDANSSSLAFALAAAGAAVVDVLVVPDDAGLVRLALLAKSFGVDLIVTTGGVSRGAYEVVRDVFEGAGVEFFSVAMQPGGPQGLGRWGSDEASIPVVAFPGNPVSALVSFEVFLRPVLRALHGLDAHRPHATAPLATSADSPEGRHQVRRARLTAAGEIEFVGGPGSHLLHSYAASTHLAHVPLGVSHLEAGDSLEIWRIDD